MSVMPRSSGKLSVAIVFMLLFAWQATSARGEEPRVLDPAEPQVQLQEEGLKVLWSQNLSQAVPDRTLKAVYATGGLVILETMDANLVHIDAEKGTWRTATSLRGPLSQPPVAAKDRLYALRGGTVLGIEPDTGHVAETLPLRLADSAPVVLYDQSLVIGTDDGKIARFDLEEGLVVWQKAVEGPVKDQPIVQNGIVYVAGYKGSVTAVYVEDGALLWSWKPPEPAQITSGLLLDGGKLYVGDNQGFVYCMDAETGMPSWKYPVGRPVSNCVALKDAKMLVCTYPGSVVCLQVEDEPKVLWQNDDAKDFITIGKNAAYLQSRDGSLCAISTESGKELWRRRLPSGCQLVSAAEEGTFYVFSPAGAILALTELD